MSTDPDPQPTSMPAPESIVFTLVFQDSDVPGQPGILGNPIDINHPVIQTYPDYLSLTNETNFFNELIRKLVFLHEIQNYENGVSNVDSFVADSQGRIFKIDLLHVSGVPT
jgi:hypothetical protein